MAHREVLPNGIVLLVAERPAIPIVAVRVYTRAGSVFEPPDRAGLANLTGSLLTRGTARRNAQQIDSAIEFVGGRIEASAGRDGLVAWLSVLKRDLTLGLDLLGEVVLTPAFPEPELKRKVAQIQAGIKRSEESPGTVASRALARLVYPGHPYGRPSEGTVESVGRLTRDDVVRFYGERVRPDTTIVAVVGAVTIDEARREIIARFGAWPRPATPAAVPPMASPAPKPDAETIKRELTQTTLMFGRQAINQRDPDYFPLSVASYILGGGSTSRLYTRVRDEGGLAYDVRSYVSPGKYGASFVVSTQTRAAETAKVVGLIEGELERMRRDPVSERDIDVAKDYLSGELCAAPGHLVEGGRLPGGGRGDGPGARLRRPLPRADRARDRGRRAARRREVLRSRRLRARGRRPGAVRRARTRRRRHRLLPARRDPGCGRALHPHRGPAGRGRARG